MTHEKRPRPKSMYKKRQSVWTAFFYMVAGVGFEPHDLRVMSPTSYLAAPSRDMVLESLIIIP